MATKKQKRQEMLEKRAAFEDEMMRTGLEAQRKDRERRRQQELEAWQKQHGEKHSWKKRIKECPHCRIEMAEARRVVEEVAV